MTEQPKLILATSPFMKSPQDTPFIMWQVIYSLLPVVIASAYFFGIGAFLIIAASILGALLPEYLLTPRNLSHGSTLKDGSAIITGILLALTLPPNIPLWMAFLGGVVSILLGKSIFGGIGHNVFNPALVGRAFLQAAFPTVLTTWSSPVTPGNFFTIPKSLLAFPLCGGDYNSVVKLSFGKFNLVDAMTTATPLGMMKFQHMHTDIVNLFFGNIAGSLGETCAAAILLGGIYLVVRKCLNWRIPVSIFATVFVFAFILNQTNPKYPTPLFQLLSGGLMLGAVFMATDMVTSPITNIGCWIFGIGIGIFVVVIRLFGGLPEGVMYAILLMNAVTPSINRYTQPKIYGQS